MRGKEPSEGVDWVWAERRDSYRPLGVLTAT